MVDIPENTTTTATIAVGGTFEDLFEEMFDGDWIAVDLVAGQWISAAAWLTSTDPNINNNTYIAIYDSAGVRLTDDDSSGFGTTALATFLPLTSGTYYIAVQDQGDIGAYRLEVKEAEAPRFTDTIDWGTKLDSNTIEVYFAPAGEDVDGRISEGWSDYEIQQAMRALEQISNICNVTFAVTTQRADAEFAVGIHNLRYGLGYFNAPQTGRDSGTGVFSPNGYGWDDFAGGGLEQGGYGFITLLHEFGHGMGMAHPFDDGGTSTVWHGLSFANPYGDFSLDQGIFSVMSYHDGWPLNPDGLPPDDIHYGNEGTMMAFDIAVLQAKYGANTDFHGGDDTYTLADVNAPGTFYSCLWDTGGKDAIVYDGIADAMIDLRPASLDYAEGSGGWISYAKGIFGGFTIAHGVLIETAKGGEGNDHLIGNEAENVLRGRGGIDVLIGGLGGDVLRGGRGADQFAFLSLHDSRAGAEGQDEIADFRSGVDQIDLSAIDGQKGGTEDDSFLWIGTEAFHNVRGELRWEVVADGVLIEADRSGDGTADFTLLLAGASSLLLDDLVL